MSYRGEVGRSHEVYGRVIVHADLDCFYCQVEHVRLGIPTTTPLAVQQWDGIIAVNYEARKFGVKRGDRAVQAKEKCPDMVLVHVGTIGGEDDTPPVGDDLSWAPDRGHCKVSLQRYREASFAIMAIFQAHCRRVERASIDEAYMDITEEAAKLCEAIKAGKGEDLSNAPETDLQGTAGHRLDPTSAFDRILLAGARLTATMRSAVEQELGFTVSAGIASNKVLAKLASSRNKPNKQTVVSAGASCEMLDAVPLRKLRGLGGKLGESVVAWSKAETASELKAYSRDELAIKFGPKTGEWLWRICRGMDDEAVAPNLRPKSLSVCKSFAPLRDREAVVAWMTLLATELADRIVVDRKFWNRRVSKLTLHTITRTPGTRSSQATPAGSGAPGWKVPNTTRSRTVDIPGAGEPPTVSALVSEAMALLDKTENALPCCRLVLTAHDFASLVSGRASIASFLRTSISPPSPKCGDSESLCSTVAPRDEDGDRGRRDEADPGRVGGDVKLRDNRSRTEADPNVPVCGDRLDVAPEETHVGRSDDPRDREYAPPGQNVEQCPRCGKGVAPSELPEHLDFHYAQGLQDRYTREGGVAAAIANATFGGGKGKRKRLSGSGGRNRQSKQSGLGTAGASKRIDSFFKQA